MITFKIVKPSSVYLSSYFSKKCPFKSSLFLLEGNVWTVFWQYYKYSKNRHHFHGIGNPSRPYVTWKSFQQTHYLILHSLYRLISVNSKIATSKGSHQKANISPLAKRSLNAYSFHVFSMR